MMNLTSTRPGPMKITSVLLSLFLIQTLSMALQETNINTDQSALLAFKTTIISEPNSIFTKNWSISTPVCTWAGIICSARHGRVISLNISSMNLAGTIPPQLGNLSFLSTIDLSNNGFHGSLPEDLVKLHRLEVLKLNNNLLNGEVPSWLGYLSNLQVLNIANNSFVGSIPSSIFNLSKLEVLHLFTNALEGEVPNMFGNLDSLRSFAVHQNRLTGLIPSTIFNVSSIEAIGLAKNNFSGTLLEDMCKNTPNLQKIYLHQNSFHGQLQGKFQNCYALQVLSIWENSFSGTIPKEIGNLTALTGIDFSSNMLTGEIPQELGQLYNLEVFKLSYNSLTGSIPSGVFNMSGLITLAVDRNHLTGNLPSDMGRLLPKLETLLLTDNNFNGYIPASISNCSQLNLLDIGYNEFTGYVPHSFGELSLLEFLYIDVNNLTDEKNPSSELSFITSLTKCRLLSEVEISLNPWNPILPSSIGNLSASTTSFSAEEAMIIGTIPMELGNLSSLLSLRLSGNQISGPIPKSNTGFEMLQQLYLDSNQMEGSLPDTLCIMNNLGELNLSTNQFSGAIPNCLGNVTSLRFLALDTNSLVSTIPESLWQLKDILNLSLASNNLRGSLSPQIGNLKSLLLLDLSNNHLAGDIPATIGSLSSLNYLSLAHNGLQGSIPDSFGGMLSLVFLDLSHNMISGLIPKSLEKLEFLHDFDISFNRLSGEIPSGGPFKNFTSQSFMQNAALCGDHAKYNVPSCPQATSHTSKKRVILYVVFSVLGAALLAMAVAFVLLRYKKRNDGVQGQKDTLATQGRISYYELLQATNGFSESNWLGSGSYGSVYKGFLRDGTNVAVKRFDLQVEGSFKSFDRECEVLRNLRHRNLTKVISSCSSDDFKALVLEYMPTGSLDKWLYSHNNLLPIRQRLDIMIDVACALDYLHHDCETPVVHCDIKPSNILLDEDMVAHVSDFGIAKLLYEGNSIENTKTLATFGYIAPEYGLEGLVSTRCDVYSYGIMLMEVFTRVKPSDEMFLEGKSLKSWVKEYTPNATTKVVDANLLNPNEQHLEEKLNCVTSLFELALQCTYESPNDRLNMKEVVAKLQRIKAQFHAYLEESQYHSTLDFQK